MAIVSTAKRDLSIVAGSEDLLDFMKERTQDKKVCVDFMIPNYYILTSSDLYSERSRTVSREENIIPASFSHDAVCRSSRMS